MFLCFAEPKDAYGGFFNKLAAFFTRGTFCHVAVIFELPQAGGGVKFQECSIVRSTDDRFNRVHLSAPENMEGWTVFRLQLQKPEYELEAYNYVCNNLLGVHYDNIRSITDFTFYWCIPIGYGEVAQENRKKTYCSRLALVILQRAGQFIDHSLNRVSPNDIFDLIQKDKTALWTDVTSHVPAIFSEKSSAIPVSYVYTNSSAYTGLLSF